ncbi:hypothetical protein [Paenibacillus humicola]|uniref:hypothetical protein n=1 Tax=Paenibacillus humicola TaxID=3110540 RepID=UPI00237BC561|nr:hypothetical protein [Paenibacillus humicola]
MRIRMRRTITVLTAVLLLTTGMFTGSSLAFAEPDTQRPDDKKSGLEVTTDYLFALRTADQFLQAWLNRDLAAGTALVTDKVKREAGENGLFAFFVGTSNPHHEAFELKGKRQADANTYIFRAWLYEHVTGQQIQPFKRGKGSAFEVVKTGVNEAGEGIWRVNSLPQEAGNPVR